MFRNVKRFQNYFCLFEENFSELKHTIKPLRSEMISECRKSNDFTVCTSSKNLSREPSQGNSVQVSNCSMNCEVADHPINLWNLLFVFLTLITSHIDNTTNPFSSFIQEPFTVDYCLSTFKLSTVVTFEYHLPFTVFLCLYDCRSCIRKFLLSLIKSTFNSLSCDI